MNLLENEEIKPIMARLELHMIEYITPGETAYNKKDVEQCMQIMSDYLKDIAISTSKEDGLKVVERTVLALNELNENCEHELIETGQREDICEIIILAGNLKGYNGKNDDITEDWREW